MPTPTKGPRLGGSPAHERLLLSNLARALFEHGRITTTEAKAKRLRPYAERLITFAKKGDLHARRQVLSVVPDKDVVAHLFAEIGPRFTDRPGGYTRITKVGPRKGDNAPMAIIELVEGLTVAQTAVGEAERARGTRFAGGARRDRAAALSGETDDAAAGAGPNTAAVDDLETVDDLEELEPLEDLDDPDAGPASTPASADDAPAGAVPAAVPAAAAVDDLETVDDLEELEPLEDLDDPDAGPASTPASMDDAADSADDATDTEVEIGEQQADEARVETDAPTAQPDRKDDIEGGKA